MFGEFLEHYGGEEGKDEEPGLGGLGPGLGPGLGGAGGGRPPARRGFSLRPPPAGAQSLDLNDPKNLEDLEDPGLRERVAQARARLAEQERLLAELPPVEELADLDCKAQQALSRGVTAVGAQHLLQVSLQADVEGLARAARALAGGERPSGFPPLGEADDAACVTLLANRLLKVADLLGGVADALKAQEADLTRGRRDAGAAADGWRRRAEALAPCPGR
jgi:hypothetical protein